ncbi:circadian clock protein KaiC [Kribbella steppae]|uniref:non-specific serine/threonine protein kinase n=1 Tax=Kribbella steppae TaxID=2512223 RepID=A0A4R2H473_9ACTN|nr:ATPase domain-containing protein [Kribbella steppae]TCO20279.1 circadian clock protein KaiC [Kribbella steppae]
MNDRMTSGSDPLDVVLGGGLPRNAIVLVMGAPGAGKTIVAQQWVFANATPELPALYLSTVSEPLEKLLRYGQTLSFFDPTAVGRSIWYEDLGTILRDQGLQGVLDRVRELIRVRQPAMIVIDSFKAMHPYAGRSGGFRPFLHDLAGMLSAFPATSMWVGEYQEDEIQRSPEFAVADAIIALKSVRSAERTSRVLQVHKLRGGGFLSGTHSYRLSDEGITVYPRLADPADSRDYELRGERVPSGIQALDDMLEDGYWSGASTLVAGPTGIGKTLMGLHFVFHAVNQGERAIIATMQEHPSQLERTAAQFGWSVKADNLILMYRSPVDLNVDQWVYELLDMIETTGASRVLLDSLADLQVAAPDQVRFREYLYSLLHRSSRYGTSLMMTYELPELFGVSRLSDVAVSHLADNVVLLQYRRVAGVMSRTLTVLKTRATDHESGVKDFEITADGIMLVPEPATE